MTEKQAYKILTNTPIRAKENHTEYSKALHIALGALGRQMAEKPINIRGTVINFCPNCKAHVIEQIHDYCGRCGQRLSWRDAE